MLHLVLYHICREGKQKRKDKDAMWVCNCGCLCNSLHLSKKAVKANIPKKNTFVTSKLDSVVLFSTYLKVFKLKKKVKMEQVNTITKL